MKSKHLSTLLDVVTKNQPVIDFAKANNINYKTLTNTIFYGKKLYNKHKRVKDPVLKRIDNIKDRNALIMGITYVYNKYRVNSRPGRPVQSLSTKTARMASPLPYHFDTFASMDDAWSNVSSRVKDGEDMSLLIKFYNTIVKEANSINSNQ